MGDHYGAAAVCFGESGVFLVQEDETKELYGKIAGMWSIPMGHSNPGETGEDCIRREFAEETGRILGPVFFVGFFIFPMRDGNFVHLKVYVGTSNGPASGLHHKVKEVEVELLGQMPKSELRFPSLACVEMALAWKRQREQ